MRVIFLDPANAFNDAMAVSVGCIYNNRVHASTGQQLNTLLGALAHAHRRADAQLAMGITCCVGETGLFGDVLDCNQSLEFKGIVDYQ